MLPAAAGLVRGEQTGAEIVDRALTWVADLGKTPIVVQNSPGFASTRLGAIVALEAIRMLEQGVASAEDIDTACKLGFGHAMGPLATTDLTGVDILRNASMNIYADTADEKFFPPESLSRMVAAGDLGRKSGRGFYTYDS